MNSDYQPFEKSDWQDAIALIHEQEWVNELVTHRYPLSKGKDVMEEIYRSKKQGQAHKFLKCLLTMDT